MKEYEEFEKKCAFKGILIPKDVEIAVERYQDLCGYFGEDENLIQSILKNGDEFRKWLERVRWNIHKVDELSNRMRELEKRKDHMQSTQRLEIKITPTQE